VETYSRIFWSRPSTEAALVGIRRFVIAFNSVSRGGPLDSLVQEVAIRDVLEERLLARLQSELLRPEVIEYAVAEFARQLRVTLANMSVDLGGLRQRKELLEREIRRFTDAIARR
jgi:hypothetical protein